MYADAMADGAVFEPVDVYYDGSTYWLADGYHRADAARKLGESINAKVHEGGERDAILHGVGANDSHGIRRTQADKRRAVERLVRDKEWGKWSDRKIAEVAKVDHKTVGKIRRELLGGEFPTPAQQNGEIPRTHGKPNSASGSVVETLLKGLPDEVLIEECARRGLKVEATDA